MVNPNRWSWSGAPRKAHARENAVASNEPLIPPTTNPDSCEGSVPAEKKVQPGAAGGVSSRRLSYNRWSWRPDAAISVTLEDQQEDDSENREQGEDQGQATQSGASNGRRLSKINKTLDAAAPTKRPRPLSMIAPASASFGSAPSYSHFQRQQQAQQQETGNLPSPSQPSPLTTQPSAGVKEALGRFLTRKFSKRQMKTPRQQQSEAEPVPPPSQHQQQQTSGPMQSSMRRGPQLHNPQNTLRGGSPANPATHAQTQAQGRIENGRMAAPLPGLDEQPELQEQLPPPTDSDSRAAPASDAATSVDPGATSSQAPTSSADDTGILGRLMRRRLAPKDKDVENDNKKRSLSTSADNTSQSAGADHENSNSSDPLANADETTDHEMQAQSMPLSASHASQKKLGDTTKTQEAQTVSDARNPSSSSVPRFLRQVAKPQQAKASPNQVTGAITPHKRNPQSQSSQAQHQQHMSSSTPSAQPKLRAKPSFGKRFWSRSGANDFGDDNAANADAETPAPAPVSRPVYVPKHAASDFSRTTYPPRHHRHSFSLGNGENGVRPLATITAEASEDEPQRQVAPEQRNRTPSAEKAEKRRSRELSSSSKFDGPSPQELHRRLEIVKSSEIEVVTTREPTAVDHQPQQHQLPQINSNASSANGKGPAKAQPPSRPRSSQRHSFNLVADPYARDLTPPKSASPVEMEAPFDPPSHAQQQTVEPTSQYVPKQASPPRQVTQDKSSHGRSQHSKEQAEEKPRKEMTDFERFIADAEAAEREHHAQMWRNLARRSGHYGYSDSTYNPYTAYRPDQVSTNPSAVANTQKSGKRDSAYYSVGKRASMMTTAAEDERNFMYGQPLGDNNGLKHQGSISKRIADYIKPSKSGQEAAPEDWMAGRANRRSVIAGVAEE
ncbi:hypothetical protein CGMCC3_g12723 [Colletotrichum fructicola]|uniref:Uncharacterized protein n=1 Tax=Colletotrichum fructicola (strain Nara gc5) TaxID=1213859 RepID=L2FQZ4_COLFN|nr:uncharacterized protein CGMCC3_g12723 [Colletotrichum fructicola]KAE9571079.1 hypothetical protein CGMCC3_g12723 [Colletotrichum fructicola]KAF4490040.1 hypothetical protein CGGC5_v004706 [Colletotrichum fructicola Nara gc5]KAF4889116.1 hypothetical protein CGCFRS4_v009502 [Colletotrichum fructicola]